MLRSQCSKGFSSTVSTAFYHKLILTPRGQRVNCSARFRTVSKDVEVMEQESYWFKMKTGYINIQTDKTGQSMMRS